MSTRLVILGLLRQRPLYGYEIKSIIEDHMADWTNIAFGSIYFALGKLSEEGFIEKIAIEQTGNRPSRSIYQLTKSGEKEFLRLLNQVWREFERQFFPFDIGLFFIHALKEDEIIGRLNDRISQLEIANQYLNDHQREQVEKEEVPTIARAIFDHSRVHMQAEIEWLRDLLGKVKSGIYPGSKSE